MREYKIYDLAKGLFSGVIVCEAKTPFDAVKKYIKAQYPDKSIERDYSAKGDFVVYGERGSYVYKVKD